VVGYVWREQDHRPTGDRVTVELEVVDHMTTAPDRRGMKTEHLLDEGGRVAELGDAVDGQRRAVFDGAHLRPDRLDPGRVDSEFGDHPTRGRRRGVMARGDEADDLVANLLVVEARPLVLFGDEPTHDVVAPIGERPAPGDLVEHDGIDRVAGLHGSPVWGAGQVPVEAPGRGPVHVGQCDLEVLGQFLLPLVK